jgi:general secretion pathway protein G
MDWGRIRKALGAWYRPRQTSAKRPGEAGFTLIELLVVMVILVLLASLVAPRVIGYLGSSRTKTAKVQIESLRTSLELFKLDT